MRISSLISTVENGVIAATKAAARQSRRINRAVRVELAAGRIADGEQERLRLAERANVDSAEIMARTNELLVKRSRTDLQNEISSLRSALAKRVNAGAKFDEIEARSEAIDELERLLAMTPITARELVGDASAAG